MNSIRPERLAAILLGLLFSVAALQRLPAQADSAGLPPRAEQPVHAGNSALGRLFHTPAQRRALDHPAPSSPHGAPRQAAQQGRVRAPEQQAGLSGFVLRSDGKNSYWLETPSPGCCDAVRPAPVQTPPAPPR